MRTSKMVFVAAALVVTSFLCPSASRAADKATDAKVVATVKVAEVEGPKEAPSGTCDAKCEALRVAAEHLPAKDSKSSGGDSAAEVIVVGGGAL